MNNINDGFLTVKQVAGIKKCTTTTILTEIRNMTAERRIELGIVLVKDELTNNNRQYLIPELSVDDLKAGRYKKSKKRTGMQELPDFDIF